MAAPVYEKKALTKKSENIADWYHDVVLRAGLAEYADVKGCMIIKPHGYALWEHVQSVLDAEFKADGVRNVYFPLFIPMHLLQKEQEHVAGFSPELAVVTHAGGEELAEPLAIRPTSETIMYATFANWVQSWRDLPLKTNQWCNVVRWEKRTYPFLRTSEFLWQEGHTVHADEADAMDMVLRALDWYRAFYEEEFAISPYVGLKSAGEKFAGAERTYSVELVLPDGKALQAATSHYLGTHFASVFGVNYLDAQGASQVAHQTSWGLSTRSIGGLVLVHGDDSGLVLPPRAAPEQVVVLAVGSKSSDNAHVQSEAANIADELKHAGIRAVVDTDLLHSLGYRINEHELRGVPVRLEVGARELADGKITAVRRDTLTKSSVNRSDIVTDVQTLLSDIQSSLLERSEKLKRELTKEAATWEEFTAIMEHGKAFIRAPWCERPECEADIKAETKATPRVLELDRIDEHIETVCVKCGEPAHRRWLFAQSY
ncbi:MAG TPA: proline--tRNA ligase [Candidatus Paceibacterota bacterium]|nr:proline--tRNA ligase [Candidatus Paceibacterota bacterium]